MGLRTLWHTEYGSCYGNGLKEDIRINPKIGLLTNTGKEALPEGGISEQEETSYCFYPKLGYTDIFL
ncbi:hypothetical protein MSBRW_0562 [Methanosarcina barkeri str. Wiesmoor]|uniref:Uncharacterized protein n=1 Tax=Methanosarcina barkeri str. Wiesmoor TaxID=1434109 RepID=A0A0E3QIV4_METBA|nr:hypothetical protein [Methanosarcina barkeri]AKB49815.1 hypothetical protein MSBRW_0562 [Methanosarcina barkeri str. Wiesmoor]